MVMAAALDLGPDAACGRSVGCGGGRAALAARRLAAGERALARWPLAAALRWELRAARCAVCYADTAAAGAGTGALSKCGRCEEERYCSRACQMAAWKGWHKLECSRLRVLREYGVGKSNADIADADSSAKTQALLLGRALRAASADAAARERLCALRPAPNGPEERMKAGAMTKVSPADVARVQARMTAYKIATAAKLVPEGEQAAGLPKPYDCLLAFDSNNFGVLVGALASQEVVAAAVYPEGAMLNSSCSPNCFLSYEPPENGGAGKVGRVQVFRALRDIGEGEELTHCYVDAEAARGTRRAELSSDYGFDCKCERCVAEADGAAAAADESDETETAGAGLVNSADDDALRQARASLDKAAAEEDPAEELALLRSALPALERAGGSDALRAGDAAATAALAAGELAFAASQYSKNAARRSALHPEGHPRPAADLYAAAAAAAAAGDVDAAAALAAEALPVLRRALGERAHTTKGCATLLEALGGAGE